MQYARGIAVGTGASLDVPCGFKPTKVLIRCRQTNVHGYWLNSMADAAFVIENNDAAAYNLRRCGLSIGTSSDKALKVGAAIGTFLGVKKYKASAEVAFTATTHDVTKSKWGSFRVSMASNGTVTLTVSAAVNHNTEALAIAGLAATPANEISLGYITIKAGDAADWDATGHSLAGGGTSPAAETNYYSGEPDNLLSSGGITSSDRDSDSFIWFKIGTSALINVAGYLIEWEAFDGIVI